MKQLYETVMNTFKYIYVHMYTHTYIYDFLVLLTCTLLKLNAPLNQLPIRT